jgi:predicted aspartyl protease
MRVMRRSLFLLSLSLLSVTASPAVAGAACGALNLLTSLDMRFGAGGRPMITALINDKPVGLLVDTGGALSQVTKRTVRELNLLTSESNIYLTDISGQKETRQVRLPSITLGRVRQEGAYFHVSPGEEDPNDPPIDVYGGILGPEILKNVDVDLDFAGKKLNLISPDHCPGNVVYWGGSPVAIVPITINQSGHVSLRVELDGRRVTAILDTGASTTVLNLDIARRNFRIDTNAPDVERAGELTGVRATLPYYRKRFNTIALEGVTINNPMITLMPDMMAGAGQPALETGSLIRGERGGLPELILGMNVLSQMHVYIAYRERRLYITAANPTAANPPAAASPSPQ